MRSYKDYLEKNKIKIEYQKLSVNSDTYMRSLIQYIERNDVKNISIWEIEDKWFEKQFREVQKYVDKITVIESPMFLTRKEEFLKMCPERKSPKYKMTDFYINQRKRLNILMNDNKPVGGKWTYDNENRKKIPKSIDAPSFPIFKHTNHTKEIISSVLKEFKNHPGDETNFNYPTTREQALVNLDHFIKEKFKKFGDYEDSVDQRSHLWYHSNLSSSLNIGLITPEDIIGEINNIDDIPINSYEGFIRQIIGWREFMRCIYHYESEEMEKRNFFNHKRRMKESWYTGQTGLEPLDVSIKSTIKHAYSHHIERLMIQVNLMNLCEIDPKNVYKWFMELYIDSSDWVMTPNVYSMGLFADGGIMATKPYICGSNYILKMMDFKKGDWCDTFDGLYWRFIDKNRSFFKTNARLNMMVSLFDKMNQNRKELILLKAEKFITENTK
jgi:deoxyribodipyrimidine photolyase-related protein